MTEHFIRHGDYLMVVDILNDPVFLSEPFIRTTNFALEPDRQTPMPGGLRAGSRPSTNCRARKGYVPHYLPDEIAHIQEFVTRDRRPAGGARAAARPLIQSTSQTLQQLARTIRSAQSVAQGPPRAANPRRMPPGPATGEVRVCVQGNVYLLAGAGGNIAVQVGDDGVLLVDTGTGSMSDKVLAAIRQLSDKPIRFILNTHAHPDTSAATSARQGGQPRWRRAAADTTGTGRDGDRARRGARRASARRRESRLAMPVAAWPTDTYAGDSKDVFLERRSRPALSSSRRHTPTATASSSSAARTSSSPATFSTSPAIR